MDKKTILKRYKGKALAHVIFEGYHGISRALDKKVTPQAVGRWRNNSVPARHRAALVKAARDKGWDVDEFSFRGDL